MDAEAIAKELSEAQRERILSANPDDVDRFHYHPFKGRSKGLFNIAPGWQRLELSPLGRKVRAILKGE